MRVQSLSPVYKAKASNPYRKILENSANSESNAQFSKNYSVPNLQNMQRTGENAKYKLAGAMVLGWCVLLGFFKLIQGTLSS